MTVQSYTNAARRSLTGDVALGVVLGLMTLVAPAHADFNPGPNFRFPMPQQLAPSAKAEPSVAEVRKPQSAGEIFRLTKSGIAHVITSYPVDNGTVSAFGTAFLVDAAGYLVTNFHVVDSRRATGSVTVQIEFADGSVRMSAKLIGADELADLAVLRVESDVSNRQVLRFAQPDSFQPGDDVVAIGYGRGYYGGPSVTRGLISQLHRNLGQSGDLVQTDAAVNHGNSGGPLLDMYGDVVGVVTLGDRSSFTLPDLAGALKKAKKSSETPPEVSVDVVAGVGFARDALTTSRFVHQIIAHGEVARPRFGLDVVGLDPERVYLDPMGVVVKSVEPGSPAARGGLKARAIIYKVDLGDGTSWATPDVGAFQNALGLMAAGREVRFHYYLLSPKGEQGALAKRPFPSSEASWFYIDMTPGTPAQRSAAR